MKKLLLWLCFLPFVTIAQQSIELKNGLLFPQFKEGTVMYKNGSSISARMNYNTIDEEMLFIGQDGIIMALADANTVGSIIFSSENRRFIPSKGDAFYEVINLEGDHQFFIDWKSKLISQGKSLGYGGNSSTAAVTDIGSVSGRGAEYARLASGEKFETSTTRSFYIKVKSSYKRFSDAKSLAKLFKGHETEIQEYVKENKTIFSNFTDVKGVLNYCYQLK